MPKGILTVLSGFSGAGKGTAMKRLMEKYDDYALSISATREIRGKARWTEENIFSKRQKNLKK